MAKEQWTEVPIEDDEKWTEVSLDDPEAEPMAEVFPEESFGRKIARGAIDTLPYLGAAGGGILGTGVSPIAGTVGGAGLGYAGGKELAGILKNKFLDDEANSVDPIDQIKRVGGNLADGAAMEMGGQLLGKGAEALASQYVGDKLGSAAEKLAVNATGATGSQASKFADDAGRELLDRNIVRFGDTPENIARRAGSEMESANSNIDTALKSLDSRGVTASSDNVVAQLKQKINMLKQDPSQAGVVRKLESIVEDILNTGRANVPVSAAEQTKRGFSKMAGNWMDQESGQAGKQAYLSYMDEVERAAQAADPKMANMFKEGKETYGLLAPIEEAATKRAFQQNQAPFGGLGDWAAAAAGAPGGPIGAVSSVVGKKLLAPRAMSSSAVTLDKISKALMTSPKMEALYKNNPALFNTIASKLEQKMGSGLQNMDAAENESKPFDQDQLIQKTQGSKYAQVLQGAAQRGPQAFGATHFILQNKDPEYRKITIGEDE